MMEESNLITDNAEESNVSTGEISEAEEWLFSDAEEASSSENNITLSIDYNARIVTEEVKCGNEGDNCDMYFVEKKEKLRRMDSESGHHTSTEDLNVSDEEMFCSILTRQPINLDGVASTSSSKDGNSLSTLDYSHTSFKGESSLYSGHGVDEIKNGTERKVLYDDKQNKSLSGLTMAGLPCAIKTASSFLTPPIQIASNNASSENVFPTPVLDKNEMTDLSDDPEAPPMTCLEFLKTEYSDYDTDAEDISIDSVDEIAEPNKIKISSGKGCNLSDIPVSLSALSFRNIGERKDSYFDDSRRSSTAEFHTEDETFNLENFSDRGRKRIKKRDFILAENGEKSDSGTDEEMIQEK